MTTAIVPASQAVVDITPVAALVPAQPASPMRVIEQNRRSIFNNRRYGIKRVENATTMREAFEAAGLNFTVEKRELFVPQASGVMVPAPGAFATVRTDSEQVLGIVGKDYTPLDNWTGCEILDMLIDGRLGVKGTVENVGLLHNGARVFAQVQVGEGFRVRGDDLVRNYLTFTNTHDGSLRASFGPTSIRIVCENTHLYATREAGKKGVSFKHTAKAIRTIEEARERLAFYLNQFALYEQQTQMLVKTPLALPDAKNLAYRIFGADPADPSKQSISAVENVLTRAESGIGNAPFRGTAWALYNGVTEYVNHGGMRTRVVDGADADELLLNSRMYGTGKSLMDNALDVLVDYAKKA